LTDERLVSKINEGDQRAFKQLVEMHQDRTYSICLGYLRNEEDAEDLAQEVFLEVFRSIHKFNGKSTIKTWIYRIAVNKSLEQLRRNNTKKRFGFLSSILGNEDILKNQHNHFDHPGIKLENKERANILFLHLEQLPKNQRAVFQLHKVDQMSYQEVAEVLEISLSSVESLMFRAKKNLQKSLRQFYQNDKS
jgi:RNA polymerase sigma-70 factor (ECF subfamily)